ncbi:MULTISPECIES: hypothetical protein [unclassified Streptomyces]|uniref:hypothetical protein n=1 Tax=unclassified Streptomyces TaxID=2593676 RepID=UPI0022595041|nr:MULTISPECIES: hypothetical protein [unclassified Streptomyces]MCX4552766.1 hypothetical protein [Streptomyces sp. NBC_01500]WSC24104.1 hypothetical protein OIE60_32960 [Streptomyces sp. NBC_01766]WSV57990.1 hypothetical protein OG282_32235 [Streptomyces sp. NBC_01014]
MTRLPDVCWMVCAGIPGPVVTGLSTMMREREPTAAVRRAVAVEEYGLRLRPGAGDGVDGRRRTPEPPSWIEGEQN